MFADLGAQGFERHEDGPCEAARGHFIIDSRRNVQNHVSGFVCGRKALALASIPSIHDDHRSDTLARTGYAGRETIDVVEGHWKGLDASFLQKFDEIRDRVGSESPMAAKADHRLFSLRYIVEYRPGGVPRQVPVNGRRAKNFLFSERIGALP